MGGVSRVARYLGDVAHGPGLRFVACLGPVSRFDGAHGLQTCTWMRFHDVVGELVAGSVYGIAGLLSCPALAALREAYA